MYKSILPRLITGLFAMLMLCSSALAQQRVTVNINQSSLKTLFDTIEKQTSYRFSYINGVLENEGPVTIRQENVPLILWGVGIITVYLGIKICEASGIDWKTAINWVYRLEPIKALAGITVICGIIMVISYLCSLRFLENREF